MKKTGKRKRSSIGSSLEDFLREEGVYEACNARAVKEVLALQLQTAMRKNGLSKIAMATRMRTSRAALDRLLDPGNTAVTLHTLMRAAETVGRRVRLELI